MRNPSPPIVLAVMAFGVFVAADDLTVVSTMLRQIIVDLEIPLPQGLDRAAWIVNAYLIAYVVVMPFIGRVSDIIGRRLVYMGAMALFLLGSIWVPLATDLNWFIVGRVLTALGGGAMVPVAMAVIGDVYPVEKRASAMGMLGAIDTAGWVWGPLYGALLVRFLDWRWQFYLNVPLSIIGLVLAWWVLRDLPVPQIREKVDWWGTAVLTITLIALNIALLNSGDVQMAGGFANVQQATWPTWPFYGVAGVGLGLFVWLQRRRVGSDVPPLLDLALFRLPNFAPAILVNFFVGAVLIIAMVNVPLVVNVLEIDVEQSALVSGYLLSGMTGAMAILAYVGGRLTERWGYAGVTAVGLLFCAVGFALMGRVWQPDTAYVDMAVHLVLLGIGFGLVSAPIATAVINSAPADQRGVASSLVIVLRLIGMSVGLSALTAWGLYRFEILRQTITLPPLGDPTYIQAINEGLTAVTVAVLAESFLICAVVAVVALFVSSRLRTD